MPLIFWGFGQLRNPVIHIQNIHDELIIHDRRPKASATLRRRTESPNGFPQLPTKAGAEPPHPLQRNLRPRLIGPPLPSHTLRSLNPFSHEADPVVRNRQHPPRPHISIKPQLTHWAHFWTIKSADKPASVGEPRWSTATVLLGITGGGFTWFVQSAERVEAFTSAIQRSDPLAM